jgi:hypothetical protein
MRFIFSCCNGHYYAIPEITNGNKYVLVTIDHYSKWCETWPIKEHDACIIVKFLEDEVICRYGVPKYILTNNGSEWMKEFGQICHELWHHTLVYSPYLASMQWHG